MANHLAIVEYFKADQAYAEGKVLVFGGSQEVMGNVSIADPKVAGVVTTADEAETTFDAGDETSNEWEFPVALMRVGRTICRVTGPVKKGDNLVTDGKGGARSADDPKEPGPRVVGGGLVGKSLEDSDQAVNMIYISV